jgi:hypothetical protein
MLANPAEVRSARQAEDGAPKRAFSVEIKRDTSASVPDPIASLNISLYGFLNEDDEDTDRNTHA